MRLRVFATGLALLSLAANIVFQHVLMHAGAQRTVLISGLADFRPAWNNGVSFSLLAQDSPTGRYLLIAFLTVMTAGVLVVMWRATSRLSSAGLGLIAGGAMGNLLDRIRYEGAVFDFLALHLGRMPLFVCNLPDIFISAGVVLLMLDSLLKMPAKETAL
ncbi:MAG TPA: signal peptidase II [Rhizomicrobium sp.]|nr:signal peptidase II [Rhizomicrobium sp.]